jgi:predicted RNA-binding Zn-ribbon protein involved in translation (DUF1610 family)
MVTEKDVTLRCLNCFDRLKVPPKADRLKCPNCGVEYVITWRGSQAKIAGTVRK